MEFFKLLTQKTERLNGIFERDGLPYVGTYLDHRDIDAAIKIIEAGTLKDTGVELMFSFDGKCALYLENKFIPEEDLKLVRDISECALELNNRVLVKNNNVKPNNTGVTYAQVINALMSNRTLIEPCKNEILSLIPTNLDSVIYEALLPIVSDTTTISKRTVDNVKCICQMASK